MSDEDDIVGRLHRVRMGDVNRWVRTYLGKRVEDVLFCEGYLSTVLGLALSSGLQVVVKIRPDANRLRGCAVVHRKLFEGGYPCPEPLVDLAPIGPLMASAETLITGGDTYPLTWRSAGPFAEALAQLVSLAPPASKIPSLEPPPPWTAPDPNLTQLWRWPDDRDIDLNEVEGPEWLEDAGWAARMRMEASASPPIVGHADWYTGNLRWLGNDLHAVFDMDSLVVGSEPAIAGLAAAVYPGSEPGNEATVEESEEFLDVYQSIRGPFSDEQISEAWAAGLWGRSFDAKVQSANGDEPKSLTEAEAVERAGRVRGM